MPTQGTIESEMYGQQTLETAENYVKDWKAIIGGTEISKALRRVVESLKPLTIEKLASKRSAVPEH